VTVWEAALWGLLGVALVEAYELRAATMSDGSLRWPWCDTQGRCVVSGYAVAVVCRVVMGTGLNAVYAAAHQMGGPVAAFTIGITAPLIMARLTEQKPEPPKRSDEDSPLATAGRSPRRGATGATVEMPAGGVDAR
jgi:hypothetical protein